MGFSEEICEAARQTLAQRRSAAEEGCGRLREEIYLKLPEVREIDSQMNGDVVKIIEYAMAAMKGEDTSAKVNGLMRENLERQRRRAELLKQNGYREDDPVPRYTCPKCGDTGFVENRRCECFEALLRAEAAKRRPGAMGSDTFHGGRSMDMIFAPRHVPYAGTSGGVSPSASRRVRILCALPPSATANCVGRVSVR